MILGVSIGQFTVGLALVSKDGTLIETKLLPIRQSKISHINMCNVVDEVAIKHYVALSRYVYLDRTNKDGLVTIDRVMVYMNIFSFVRALCSAMNVECIVIAQETWKKAYGLARKLHRFKWVQEATGISFDKRSGKYFDIDLPLVDAIVVAKVGAYKKGMAEAPSPHEGDETW
jgi:hypothetical protein